MKKLILTTIVIAAAVFIWKRSAELPAHHAEKASVDRSEDQRTKSEAALGKIQMSESQRETVVNDVSRELPKQEILAKREAFRQVKRSFDVAMAAHDQLEAEIRRKIMAGANPRTDMQLEQLNMKLNQIDLTLHAAGQKLDNAYADYSRTLQVALDQTFKRMEQNP